MAEGGTPSGDDLPGAAPRGYEVALGEHRVDPADIPPAERPESELATEGGVERRYQGGAGTGVDRYEEHQRRLAVAQHLDVDFGDAQLLYRLATDVPYHWFPFVPVASEGVPLTQGVIQLERRPLVRFLPGGAQVVPRPSGRILTASDPLRLEEDEVPRSGVDVVRTFQLARWTDGRYVLWSGKHRKSGRGEGASGLRFDSVGPPTQ